MTSQSATNHPTYNTIIADDHPLILMGLEQALSKMEHIKIARKCADGQEALEAIELYKPHFAILDIQMPKLTGLEVAEAVQKQKLPVHIILLTMMHNLSLLEEAKQYDVRGYLLKDSMLKEIENCLNQIIAGKEYFGKSMDIISHEVREQYGALENLTRMEKKVFRLIGEEKSSKEIAQLLFVSPKTISNHRYNICKKLEIGGEPNALLNYARTFHQSSR